MSRKKPESEALGPDEVKVIAKTLLRLNRGRLVVEPGTVIILGPADREQGVNIEHLFACGAIELYQEKEVADDKSSG